MGKKIPASIETRDFQSQGDALAFFKEMLNRYSIGDRVSAEDGKDLAALLKKHDDYNEKLGSGLDHFEIMSAEYGTQCFKIIRNDGSGEDFSYPHCVRNACIR